MENITVNFSVTDHLLPVHMMDLDKAVRVDDLVSPL